MAATTTYRGTTYRETDPGVWEPVEGTSGTTSADALSAALEQGDGADVLIVGETGPRRREQLRETETPDTMYVRPPVGTVPTDWTVRTWIADRTGRLLTDKRTVTDTDTLAGVEVVAARLTLDEADALVCPVSTASITLHWVVELERTAERRQAVSVLDIDRVRY